MSQTLEEVNQKIASKEREIQSIGEDLTGLRSLRSDLEAKSDEEHFRNPQPGDFWHEMYTPFFIVLAAEEGSITICEKTKPVYEDPDQEMTMRSYANPDDPEVKEYFSRPLREIGYTFDINETRAVSRPEFEKMLKCYSFKPDELTYKCIPGRAAEFARIWSDKKQKGIGEVNG